MRLLLPTLAAAGGTLAQSVLDLSDLEWTVSSSSLNISVPGSLPSHVHLDLYAAGVIGDPYYGLNDFNLRWVAWSNWTYSATLPISKSNSSASTYLLFNGLDTFTSIDLCGQHVASTNNQFRQYYFDVSQILSGCSGAPQLKINFGSAPAIAEAIATQPGQETWPFGIELTYEFGNRQFIRKEQSDFGWDWGPAFAPAGPWLPAYMVGLGNNQVSVRNTLVDIYRKGQMNNLPPDQSQPWVMNVSVDYLGSLPSGASLTYSLTDSKNKTVASGALSNATRAAGAITGSTTVPKDKVELWWPNGLGPQNLYYLTVKINNGGKSLATVQKRVGFRTIVLNEGVITKEQLAQGVAPGNNWHFEVNGYEFFAKGSNFIPPDAFWPRVTEERMRILFDSVIEGNQNMLRVWSSGAYSPDFMYSLADEMGILLWSEFEFGDDLYPVDQEFLDNVYEEVNYQVRRVNYHPSLAFWAGGNELENLELYLVNKSAPNDYEKFKKEYETLFLNTIVPAVFGNTRSISYAPSSTSNGYISLNFTQAPYFIERYEDLEPGSIYGETDFYNYDPTIAFNTAAYPVGRFSNEFGYHSMPSLQSWQQVLNPKDLHFNSSTIVLRNHHYPPGSLNTTNYYNGSLGMGEMTRAAQLWYPVPNKTNSVANFSAWCHTTQIYQADFYASEIQFYRRGSGFPQRQLGCLYWQLEDIWQAPTWASIEYDGRWKVLHYVAKDVYKNVIISPFYNYTTGTYEVYVTSDLWSSASGTVSATWYDWTGTKIGVRGLDNSPVTVGALNTTRVYSANVPSLLNGRDLTNAVMEMSVSVKGKLPNSNTTQTFTHTNWFHASPLRTAKLVDPGLTLSYDASAKKFTVKATKGVAAWIWLDYPAGAVVAFDSNAFWLAPGQSMEIGYTLKSDTTNGAWVKGVTVESLFNNTLST